MQKLLLIPKKYCLSLLLLFLVVAFASAQNKTISGNVKDKTGQNLPGVNVTIKGTNIGASTGFDGNFTINAPSNATLVISFVGYLNKEITVGDETNVKVVLETSTKSLDEVVVVAYGTQRKKNVTGAVQTLNVTGLKDIPVPQLSQKLQGKLVGVQITQNTGIPGAALTIRIRGAASISAGSDPLYVVDGFPLQGNLANINPDEIESISVLKDASSTSLYGSRASNGVVMITTKKAKSGKNQLSLSVYTGMQSVPTENMPEMMNARQFAQFKKEIAIERGQSIPEMYANPEQYGEGTDWFKAVTRDAPITNYSLSFSSSGEKFSTSVVGGYNKVEGVLLNSSYDRISVRMNSEYKFNNRVKVGANVAPTYSHNKTPQSDGIWYNSPSIIQSAQLTNPLAPYINEDGSIPLSVGWEYGTAASPNWYNQVQIVKNTSSNLGVLSNAFVEIKPIKDLTFKSTVGADIGSSVNDFFFPSTAGSTFNPPNEADATRINGSHSNQFAYSWLWENTLAYDKSIGDHNFDVLAGYTIQAAHSESGFMSGTGYPDNRVQTLNAAKTITGGTDIQDWSLASMIARVNYNYKNKYIVSAAIRRDGSSRFGADNKWGNFPSAAVGWVVSEESFIPKNDVVSFLKFRATYGVTGNNNIGNYTQYANVVPTNNPFNNQLLNGSSIAGLNNTDLGWETSTQADAGVDINFFHDRIRINYGYYKKVTDNLLYAVDLPISSGFFNYTTNIGKIEFWGHEFSLSTVNFDGKFRWTTDFNITFNKNKALELGTANASIYGDQTITKVGEPLGQFYGLAWDGIYETQAEFDASPKHEGASLGSVKYKDVNGDGIVTNDSRDQTVLGRSAPKYSLGFTSTMNYEGFDLSIVCQGAYGNKIFNTAQRFNANLDGTFNVTTDLANRWKSEADPGDGKHGSVVGNTGPERDWSSSIFLYDGSYLTIKNITFGYSFNNSNVTSLKGLRVFTSIQQAYVFTKYPGNNPEVSAGSGMFTGVDNTTYPVPRTIALGVNYNF